MITKKITEEEISESVTEEEKESSTQGEIVSSEKPTTEIQTFATEDINETTIETITQVIFNKEESHLDNSKSQTAENYDLDTDKPINLPEEIVTTQSSEFIWHEEESYNKEDVVVSKEASTSSLETKIVKAAHHELKDLDKLNGNKDQEVCLGKL